MKKSKPAQGAMLACALALVAQPVAAALADAAVRIGGYRGYRVSRFCILSEAA